MLQNQATQLINEARNLQALPLTVLEPLQQQIRQTQQLLSKAQGIAHNVEAIEREFARNYSPASLTGSQRDMVRNAQERWRTSVGAFDPGNAEAGRRSADHAGDIDADLLPPDKGKGIVGPGKLGPPLPGDLGKPILDARQRGDVAALPPAGTGSAANPAADAAAAARQRAEQEREAARSSRLFFGGGSAGSPAGSLASPPAGDEARTVAPGEPPSSDAARRQAFLERASDRRTVSGERLVGLAAPAILQAGSVIPAALITGIRSDLPGLVTAQVTQNVYDSPKGHILLIPQGSRLIGDYDADIAFGQNRVLLAWNRLILPDGRSVVLERQPASDTQGFAGLQDGTDYHWGGVLKAALVSTLLGAGAELGSGNDGNLARAFRRGTQNSINRAGEQIVSRELNVRPTLTIRPGFPVRVLVTRDLILGEGQ